MVSNLSFFYVVKTNMKQTGSLEHNLALMLNMILSIRNLIKKEQEVLTICWLFLVILIFSIMPINLYSLGSFYSNIDYEIVIFQMKLTNPLQCEYTGFIKQQL
jgi:hypothetical protein